MIPVMTLVTLVIPVIPVMDSCYVCYILLLWPLCELPQMLSSGFISDFQFYDYNAIPVHTCSLPVFKPTCLLFLFDHIMSTSCLISFVIYLPAYACSCSRHSFQYMIMIRFYRYTCAYLARHLAFASPLAWGVSSDSPGSSCPGLGAWSVWVFPVADQSGAAVAWISSRPFGALSFLSLIHIWRCRRRG